MRTALGTLAGFGVIIAISFGSATSNAGDVYYRWIDERGQPVHSDRPPAQGTQYEVVSTGSSLKRVVEADEGAVPAEVEPSVSNRFEATDQAATIEKNPEFCQRARDNLVQLDGNGRIRLRDDQGDLYYLNEEQIAAERQKALDAIDAYCE
ncbi:MAG: DUF4124 domain-containing protein [Gammaproteobacteria bacterium]|nr:DUF4124 domain-containing protein [Gammaproteobacteria bacterium]